MGNIIGGHSASGGIQRYLAASQKRGQAALGKLSSGLRIRGAFDDAAGLGASERMRSEIRGFDQASRNTLEGVDLARTADGALDEVSELLSHMRELTVQSASGTLSDADRATINNEFQQLSEQIGDLGASTEFNGKALLDGSNPSIDVQAGPSAGDTVSVSLAEISPDSLAISGEDISTAAGASSAMAVVDEAIASVSGARGELGASVNSLVSQHSVLRESSVQLSAGESRLRDADMAFEMALLTKQQILSKGSVALLSQSFEHTRDASRLL